MLFRSLALGIRSVNPILLLAQPAVLGPHLLTGLPGPNCSQHVGLVNSIVSRVFIQLDQRLKSPLDFKNIRTLEWRRSLFLKKIQFVNNNNQFWLLF